MHTCLLVLFIYFSYLYHCGALETRVDFLWNGVGGSGYWHLAAWDMIARPRDFNVCRGSLIWNSFKKSFHIINVGLCWNVGWGS